MRGCINGIISLANNPVTATTEGIKMKDSSSLFGQLRNRVITASYSTVMFARSTQPYNCCSAGSCTCHFPWALARENSEGTHSLSFLVKHFISSFYFLSLCKAPFLHSHLPLHLGFWAFAFIFLFCGFCSPPVMKVLSFLLLLVNNSWFRGNMV